MNAGQEVVVLSAVRTAIGKFGGALRDVPTEELGAACGRAALERAGVDASAVQSVIVGNVIRTKARDAYLARLCAIGAGAPVESHAVTVNRLCGSGLEAIVQASQQMQLGEIDVALAGGVEAMSASTYSAKAPRWGAKMGDVTFEDDMLAALNDPFGAGHMGVTAENVAAQFDISRETQDAFALQSHQRAVAAIEAGRFNDQIIPIEIKTRKGVVTVEQDEGPRADASLDAMAGLRAAFKKDGSVTPGNASSINDGASMLALSTREYATAKGLKPIARLVAYARAGVEPSVMGTGPIPAVRLALKRADLQVGDLDVIESNEAFAAQACAVSKELKLPDDKTNPNGGAIALGHPVGASGAIIATKLLHELDRIGGRYGLATLCIGGGQGIAAVFERFDA